MISFCLLNEFVTLAIPAFNIYSSYKDSEAQKHINQGTHTADEAMRLGRPSIGDSQNVDQYLGKLDNYESALRKGYANEYGDSGNANPSSSLKSWLPGTTASGTENELEWINDTRTKLKHGYWDHLKNGADAPGFFSLDGMAYNFDAHPIISTGVAAGLAGGAYYGYKKWKEAQQKKQQQQSGVGGFSNSPTSRY